MRNLVVLFVLLGLGVAACASSGSVSLEPISSAEDSDGSSSSSDSASSKSGDSSANGGGSEDAAKASGKKRNKGSDDGSGSGDSGSSDSGGDIDGWTEMTEGVPTEGFEDETFGGLGDVSAKVYTKAGSEQGAADAYIIDVDLKGKEAQQMAAFMQFGGGAGIGDPIKIGGKTVYKLNEDDLGGCTLMWQRGGSKMTVAQSSGSCDELVSLVEQVI